MPSGLHHLRAARGFTLVELLVVILIVGILAAVALPSLLGQTNEAKDSEATQHVATAYRNAKAVAVDADGMFVGRRGSGDEVTVDDLRDRLAAGEPELDFVVVDAASDVPASVDPDAVYVLAQRTTGSSIGLAARSGSGLLCSLATTYGGADRVSCASGIASPTPTISPYTAAVNADSPRGVWHMNGVVDADEPDIDGTFTGVSPGAFPTSGGGVVSGDDGEFIDVAGPLYEETSDQDSFSVEMWVKPGPLDSTNNNFLYFRKMYSTMIRQVGDEIRLRRYNVSPANVLLLKLDDATTWHHLVMTHEADREMVDLYVDGTLVAHVPGAIGEGSDNVRMLQAMPGAGIDEVAVYGSALSPARVQAHYAAAQAR